jgi:hypothetical protein
MTSDVHGGKLDFPFLLDTATGRVWTFGPAICPSGGVTIGTLAGTKSQTYCFYEIERLDLPLAAKATESIR